MLTLNQGKEASWSPGNPRGVISHRLGSVTPRWINRNWGAQDERPLFQANDDVVKPTTDDIVTCRRCGAEDAGVRWNRELAIDSGNGIYGVVWAFTHGNAGIAKSPTIGEHETP
jgi:hypothetical protein